MVERNIQSKKAIQHSFHLQSRLSWVHWPLTSTAARRTLNRLARASNPNRCKPYEVYFGRQPDLSSFPVFGCTTCYWILGWSFGIGYDKYSTSKQGMFVGYDEHQRAYRILPDGAKSFVVFDEWSIVQHMLFDCTLERSEGKTIEEPISNVFISNSKDDWQHSHGNLTITTMLTEATHGYD